MKKKVCVLLILMCLLASCICINKSYAQGGSVISQLSAMNTVSTAQTVGDDGIPGAINRIIGLLQLVGSGIAIIVITMLGMKYILASPSEKADVKKSIMPILIGCFLLFGGVNIAAAIASLAFEISQ